MSQVKEEELKKSQEARPKSAKRVFNIPKKDPSASKAKKEKDADTAKKAVILSYTQKKDKKDKTDKKEKPDRIDLKDKKNKPAKENKKPKRQLTSEEQDSEDEPKISKSQRKKPSTKRKPASQKQVGDQLEELKQSISFLPIAHPADRIYAAACGIEGDDLQLLYHVNKWLGRKMELVDEDGRFHEKLTHLIVNEYEQLRKHKVLAAMMHGAWILHPGWLAKSLDGEVADQREFQVPLYQKRAKREDLNLFAGLSVCFVESDLLHFDQIFLEDFVKRLGGKVLEVPFKADVVVINEIPLGGEGIVVQEIQVAGHQSEESQFSEPEQAPEEENENGSHSQKSHKPAKPRKSKEKKKTKKGTKKKIVEKRKVINWEQMLNQRHVVTEKWLLESLLEWNLQPFQNYPPPVEEERQVRKAKPRKKKVQSQKDKKSQGAISEKEEEYDEEEEEAELESGTEEEEEGNEDDDYAPAQGAQDD